MIENKRPLIFITNDDGYEAKGIQTLIDCVKDLGDIVVVAPDKPRSGMSSAITSLLPLRVKNVFDSEHLQIYACTGTPVDCVKLGISEIAKRKPDLMLSGINHGSNASICVHYSGTMGAVIEGCIFKVPSIGFSLLNHHHDADFSNATKVIERLAKQVLQNGLPVGTCLNVNIPVCDELKGLKVCRQTAGQWVDEFQEATDGSKNQVYWLTGHFENDEPNDPQTDEWALNHDYISVVPVKVDITDHDYINVIKDWESFNLDE